MPFGNRHLLALAWLLFAASATAQVQLPEPNATGPVVVTAESGNQWQLGSYEVWVLRGNCLIQQGSRYTRSREAVLWIDRAEAVERRPHKVIAYLEGDVEIAMDRQPGAARLTDRAWLGRFSSPASVEVRAAATAGKPDVLPPIYWRGMERRTPELAGDQGRSPVQQAQYLAPAPAARPNVVPAPATSTAPPPTGASVPGPALAPVAPPAAPPVASGPARRVQVFARSDVPVQIQWFPDPASNQWVAVIDSGVNVIVDGIAGFRTLDVLTDRLVIWTTSPQTPDLNRPTLQDQRTPLEFYMEGNIVFREGERTIYADRMYYDVPNHVGTILNADVLTPVRSYQGLLRLHAEVVQQTAPDRYLAKNAFLTSSRMGDPGYRFQSDDIYFEDIQRSPVDPVTGLPLVDAAGQPVVEHQRMATANNDFLFLGPVPIFYWPTMATDLNEPTYYLKSAQLRQDSVFGNVQLLTHFNGYQLLGIQNKPVGTDFDVAPGLSEQTRLRLWRLVPLRPRRHVRHSRPRRRPGRFLGHPGSGPGRPGQHPHERRARSVLPLSPLLATPRDAPLRYPTQRGTGLDQRPELPGRILQERVGHAEGRNHRLGVETHQRRQFLERHGRRPRQRLLHPDQLAAAGRPLLAGATAAGRCLDLV